MSDRRFWMLLRIYFALGAGAIAIAIWRALGSCLAVAR